MAEGTDSSLGTGPWGGLAMVTVGALVAGPGLAVLLNFRSVTERHVRKAFQLMKPIEVPFRRVPQWG